MKKKAITISVLALLNGLGSTSHALSPKSKDLISGETLSTIQNSQAKSGHEVQSMTEEATLAFIDKDTLGMNPLLTRCSSLVASIASLPTYTIHEASSTSTQSTISKTTLSDIEPTLMNVLSRKNGELRL